MIEARMVIDGRVLVLGGDCPVTGGAHQYSTYTDSEGRTRTYCINCEGPGS